MSTRRITVIMSIILFSLASSGCKDKGAEDDRRQAKDEDIADNRPSVEGKEADAAKHEREGMTVFATRTFQSDIPFGVFTHKTQQDLFEMDGFMRGIRIGQTGPGQIIQVPECYVWYVMPAELSPDWAKIATEVVQNSVPGLQVMGINDAGLSHLASLKHLIYLSILDGSITDASLRHIDDLKNLQILVLSNCDNLTDASLQHVENLENLQMLFLNCTNFTGSGLKYVKNLKNLKVLWADYNNTEPSLEYLKDFEKLQVLVLIEARTTDVGLEHVKTLKNLERLVLESANITDVGLEHLENLKNLEMLYLDRGEYTDAGLEGLRKALPKCKILGPSS
jgi:hypothetical protein